MMIAHREASCRISIKNYYNFFAMHMEIIIYKKGMAMGNTKREDSLLFNPGIMADRLVALRKDEENNNTNSLTLEQLEKNILKETNVSISGMQLGKYENADLKQRPNINNLLALSEYYGVSLEYLIGRSEIRGGDATDEHTSDKFGLSKKSMNLLKAIKNNQSMIQIDGELFTIGNKAISSDLINFVFENKDFWIAVDSLLSTYVRTKAENKRIHLSEISEVDAARYSLMRRFEDLIDDMYTFLFESQPKSRPLFEIEEKKSTRKRKP